MGPNSYAFGLVEKEEPGLFNLGYYFMMISHCGIPTVQHECFVLGMELIICRLDPSDETYVGSSILASGILH